MSVDQVVEDAFTRIIELKSDGQSDSEIKGQLITEGFPDEVAHQLIDAVNAEITKARAAASNKAFTQTVLAQLTCLVVSGLSFWGFFELKASPQYVA